MIFKQFWILSSFEKNSFFHSAPNMIHGLADMMAEWGEARMSVSHTPQYGKNKLLLPWSSQPLTDQSKNPAANIDTAVGRVDRIRVKCVLTGLGLNEYLDNFKYFESIFFIF